MGKDSSIKIALPRALSPKFPCHGGLLQIFSTRDLVTAMKTKFTTKSILAGIALAVAGSTATPLRASEDKPAKGPPLKLNVDTKPINRDSADRVSYAPIVKKTAA